MDAFYASVEQRDRPELRGTPVIVGGTGRRGVVSSASYEARRYGVRSAMPTAEAQRLCPEGVFLPGEMARYVRESARIFEIFGRFTPRVEGLSLDEAFLDLSGTERLHGSARAVGERLRATVREKTGLAVSVGIAGTKLVAKIASDLAKPDGLLEVPPGEEESFLGPLPVGRLWGVGPVLEARLLRLRIRTIGELAAAGDAGLERRLGARGVELARLARGGDERTVEPERAAVSISEESTFEVDVRDREKLGATILAHAESVARRLRSEGLRARTVVLKVKLAGRRRPGPRGFDLVTRRRTLAGGTDDGEILRRTACELLDREAFPEPIRLVGVGVTNLVAAAKTQVDLFVRSDDGDRRARLHRALDAVTERFGHGALVRAGAETISRAGLSLQRKRGEPPPRDA
ncbi:DNA polymerase IV [Myxococcaceae bacterium]|nr:DNA polymerase IV [Myxococcaceae bacterium]